MRLAGKFEFTALWQFGHEFPQACAIVHLKNKNQSLNRLICLALAPAHQHDGIQIERRNIRFAIRLSMKTDVLIAGAGPVGLTMASELARYGLSVRLIDKNADRTDKSK